MKNKKILIIIVFLLVVFSCSLMNNDRSNKNTNIFNSSINNSLSDSNVIPTYEIGDGWFKTEYYDYSKYFDKNTLDKIGFGKVVEAKVVASNGTPIYQGNVWNYTDDLQNEIRVYYSVDNPYIIECAYYIFNEYVFIESPLYYKHELYINIDSWKTQFNLYFDNYESNDFKIEKNIYKYSEVSVEYIKKFGFTDEQSLLLKEYDSIIPFEYVDKFVKQNDYYSVYLFTGLDCYSNVSKNYGKLYFKNNTIDFIDNSGNYIINQGDYLYYLYTNFLSSKYIYDSMDFYINGSIKNLEFMNAKLSKINWTTFKITAYYYAGPGMKNKKNIEAKFKFDTIKYRIELLELEVVS